MYALGARVQNTAIYSRSDTDFSSVPSNSPNSTANSRVYTAPKTDCSYLRTVKQSTMSSSSSSATTWPHCRSHNWIVRLLCIVVVTTTQTRSASASECHLALHPQQDFGVGSTTSNVEPIKTSSGISSTRAYRWLQPPPPFLCAAQTLTFLPVDAWSIDDVWPTDVPEDVITMPQTLVFRRKRQASSSAVTFTTTMPTTRTSASKMTPKMTTTRLITTTAQTVDQTNPLALYFSSATVDNRDANDDIVTNDQTATAVAAASAAAVDDADADDVDSSSLWPAMLFEASTDNVTQSLLNSSAVDAPPDVNGTNDNNHTIAVVIDDGCVGVPEYCNLTHDEYEAMLMAFIYPTWTEWVLIGAHVVVFVMGLIGNALVCIAVYTNYTMRTVTNLFIVNLAVADFFVILFCLPPTVVWDVTMTWFFGETMCKVVLYFQTVSVTVSVLTLTFISVDRWYAICFPLRYVSTNVRAFGSIGFIWALALISDVPEFMYVTTYREKLRFDIELFAQCIVTWELSTDTMFQVGRALILYLIPLILMSIAYYQIVRVLWKSDTIPGHRESRNTMHTCGYLRSNGQVANSSTLGQLRARRKAAKMLVAVVVMFAVCYFPVHLLNILRCTLQPGQNETITALSLISHWLCYANSAVNPVIYNFMSGKFRREFRNALDKCRCVRARIEDRFGHSVPPCSRTNNMSPSSRSNYQLTSLRDLNSVRERQPSMHTSFAETTALGGPSTTAAATAPVSTPGAPGVHGVNGHGQQTRLMHQHQHHHSQKQHHFTTHIPQNPLHRRLSHLQQQRPAPPL